jgi:hypothetical protein
MRPSARETRTAACRNGVAIVARQSMRVDRELRGALEHVRRVVVEAEDEASRMAMSRACSFR